MDFFNHVYLVYNRRVISLILYLRSCMFYVYSFLILSWLSILMYGRNVYNRAWFDIISAGFVIDFLRSMKRFPSLQLFFFPWRKEIAYKFELSKVPNQVYLFTEFLSEIGMLQPCPFVYMAFWIRRITNLKSLFVWMRWETLFPHWPTSLTFYQMTVALSCLSIYCCQISVEIL